MAEGNGIDLGSIYGLLVEVAKTVSRHDAMLLTLQDQMQQMQGQMRQMQATMATKAELAEVKVELAEVKKDVAGVKTEVADLRQTVIDYHGSVLGHGILISELDGRMHRVEHHLDLPPYEPR